MAWTRKEAGTLGHLEGFMREDPAELGFQLAGPSSKLCLPRVLRTAPRSSVYAFSLAACLCPSLLRSLSPSHQRVWSTVRESAPGLGGDAAQNSAHADACPQAARPPLQGVLPRRLAVPGLGLCRRTLGAWLEAVHG